MASNISTKHLQIDKAKSLMVAAIAIAAALLVFSLISARSLWSQASYHKRVITKKEAAVTQLKANIDSLSQLEESYKSFVARPANIIGGDSKGTGDRDGDNGKIVLDALPSKYDFPGLVSSIEKTLSNNGFTIESIGGTDDEIVQAAAMANSAPVEVPFEFSVKGPYSSMKDMITRLELSIRPMKLDEVDISGSDAEATVTIKAKTYFLPEKAISIKMEEVK